MSHAHPWASGAAPWMTRHVAGVAPVTPGFGQFSVTPFLDPAAPNYLESIRGVLAIPGDRLIAVQFACNGSSAVAVPANTTVRAFQPRLSPCHL